MALYAQLYLKVSEEDRAYPYIERLAATHPDLTRNLANEFMRVWTQNHDPNSSRRYSNPYMFMFGYERKAESIPLTRRPLATSSLARPPMPRSVRRRCSTKPSSARPNSAT